MDEHQLYFVADKNNGRLTNDMSYLEASIVYEHSIHEGALREMEDYPGAITYEEARERAADFYSIKEGDTDDV